MKIVYVYDDPDHGSPLCGACGRTHPAGSIACTEAEEIIDLTPPGSSTPLLDALTVALVKAGMDPRQARADLEWASRPPVGPLI